MFSEHAFAAVHACSIPFQLQGRAPEVRYFTEEGCNRCDIHIYIYIYIYTYVFLSLSLSLSFYIYIYRERERCVGLPFELVLTACRKETGVSLRLAMGKSKLVSLRA